MRLETIAYFRPEQRKKRLGKEKTYRENRNEKKEGLIRIEMRRNERKKLFIFKKITPPYFGVIPLMVCRKKLLTYFFWYLENSCAEGNGAKSGEDS